VSADQDINSPIKILLLGSDSDVGEAFLDFAQPLAEFEIAPLSMDVVLKTSLPLPDNENYDFIVDAMSIDRIFSKNYVELINEYSQWALKSNTTILMLSSALVFSGSKGSSYNESDEPDNKDKHGQVLAKIEKMILKHDDNIVLRSGWLFGSKTRKENQENDFVRKTIKSLKEGKELDYQPDFLGSPTPISDLIRVTLSLIKQRYYGAKTGAKNAGVYHYCCAEEISWLGYAKAILMVAAQYDLKLDSYTEIFNEDLVESSEIHVELLRQSLSCRKIFNHFGVKQRPWRPSLKNLIKGLYQVE